MQSIETKYIGQTNTRPAKIKAQASGGASITLSLSDDLTNEQNHDRAAIALCKKMNWQGPLMGGETKTGKVFVFDAHANRLRFESFEYAHGEVKIK
jgi:hypothetical protein